MSLTPMAEAFRVTNIAFECWHVAFTLVVAVLIVELAPSGLAGQRGAAAVPCRSDFG